ncbi:hypothetical protein HU200_021408 [Digitaria exilis]|uniref:Pterin-binding domain-containing protein n=1 Tax=Digitaria exilis TaxID=1010633 RepID=A0A835KFX3_9POAL|nr:hypothetical protein HU200_021408 [Digitaria exilis]
MPGPRAAGPGSNAQQRRPLACARGPSTNAVVAPWPSARPPPPQVALAPRLGKKKAAAALYEHAGNIGPTGKAQLVEGVRVNGNIGIVGSSCTVEMHGGDDRLPRAVVSAELPTISSRTHAAVLTFLPLLTPVASPTARRPSSLPIRRRRRPSLPPSSFPAVAPSPGPGDSCSALRSAADRAYLSDSSPFTSLCFCPPPPAKSERAALERPIRDAFTVPEHPRGYNWFDALAFLIIICSTMLLHAKESLKKMYPVAVNYFGGLLPSVSFSVSDLVRPLRTSRHAIPFRARSFTQCSADQEIVIAMGSNVGDRVSTFDKALQLMKSSGVSITRHANLYETAPAYVTDQPRFLNSAIRGTTRLGPHELLNKLKEIEKDIGRTSGIRYGPRPIDLDILLYGNSQINTETLIVPHERIHERPFVLAPLVDLLGASGNDDIETSWRSLSKCSGGFFELWNKLGGESIVGTESIKRVLPIGNHLFDWCERTLVMGVLNLTPDSFSDGGKFQHVEAAISQAKLLISEGADIIDIGAQSTRPFAKRLSPHEELERLVPVLDVITKIPEMEGKLLSVDTFHAEVAFEAVKRGVHMINDVSGGQLDPKILKVAAELKVPYVAMHMRGDPSTMQSEQNLQYDDVCKEVASELYAQVREAELSGIPLWRIVLDPGIGFSKKSKHNLEVIMGLKSIRSEMSKMSIGASHVPILLGPSRKRFLGEICNRENPVERDVATVTAVTAGILNGANIIRLHNAGYGADAAKVCDALRKGRRWED